VKNAHIWVVIESAMQAVRQLPLCVGASPQARVLERRLVVVGLDDHAENV